MVLGSKAVAKATFVSDQDEVLLLCNILFSLGNFATLVHPISVCVVRCHWIG